VKEQPSIFQVLLLDNDESQDVSVQESVQVNFSQVKAHLRNGGSVFITSKNSQKIRPPTAKAQQNYARSRKTVGFLFRQQIRTKPG
jgi:hypothetical protein